MKPMQVWCVVCQDGEGQKPRFITTSPEQASFWFNWVKNTEPEANPDLQLMELVPVQDEN